MRAFALVAGLAAGGPLLAGSTPSLADDTASNAPSAAPAAHPDGQSVWYGWQLLLADGLVTGLVAAGLPPALAGAYLFDGPLIHIAHHDYVLAAVSGGLRLGLPLIGAEIGAAAAQCGSAQQSADYANGDFHGCSAAPVIGAVMGAGVGALSAMVVDAAISWERLPGPDSGAHRPTNTAWMVPVASPTVGSDRSHGFTLGVAGAF